MFIAVEGIDGAGKTSLSKMLANKLNCEYSSQKELSTYMCIPDNQYLNYCHNYRETVSEDGKSMLMLYSLSCFLAGRKQNVVCDRHLPTVFFWYGDVNTLFVAETIYKLTRKPDLTIILEVTSHTAIDRIKKKLENNLINNYEAERDLRKAEKANDFVPNMLYFLKYFNLPYVIIDANNRSMDKILSEALSAINLNCGVNIQ